MQADRQGQAFASFEHISSTGSDAFCHHQDFLESVSGNYYCKNKI